MLELSVSAELRAGVGTELNFYMRVTLFFLLFLSLCGNSLASNKECVVLLHGLARVSNSMAELERKLDRSGFLAVNITYPSRRDEIELLAEEAIGRGLSACGEQEVPKVHFVTHSLGGILVRQYLEREPLSQLGRVVMLGPPNQGTALVDRLRQVPGWTLLGPAADVLGTGPDSIISKLGPVQFELGVIAGDVNVNPLAALFLQGENDSVVTVESTRVAGMDEHLVLPVIHTIMMRNNLLIDHTIHYLKTGNFIPQ